MDWKMNQLQRDALAKRGQLDALNAQIAGLDAMLDEARSFEGHYATQIEALDRQISAIGPAYDGRSMFPQLVRRPNEAGIAEIERLTGVRDGLIRERDEEMARRTTTGSDGFHTLTFCALRPDDVTRRRAHIVIVRDQVARELAAIEAQLTPGELVQSGRAAPDFTDYTRKAEALRSGRFVVAGGTS